MMADKGMSVEAVNERRRKMELACNHPSQFMEEQAIEIDRLRAELSTLQTSYDELHDQRQLEAGLSGTLKDALHSEEEKAP